MLRPERHDHPSRPPMRFDSSILRFQRFATGGLLVLLASCDSAPERDPTAATGGDLPVWSLTEELRIGSFDKPNYSLTMISDLAVSPDGRIYVAQREENLIRVYDREGRFVRNIGAPGPGPGEFEGLDGIGILGDTLLYAADRLNPMVSYFTLEGEFVHSEGRIFGGRIAFTPDAILPDGREVATLRAGDDGGTVTILTDGAGQVVDTLFVTPSRVIIVHFGNGRLHSSNPLAVYRTPWSLLAADGTRFVTIDWDAGDGTESTFALALVTIDGDTLFRREFRYRPVRRPQEYVDSVIESTIDRLREITGLSRSEVDRVVRDQTMEGMYLPPIAYATFTDAGDLWVVRNPDDANERQHWQIFDRQGEIIARIDSLSVSPYVIRGDTIWGGLADDLGLPNVGRLRIGREPAPS
jgi:hypothetical protein